MLGVQPLTIYINELKDGNERTPTLNYITAVGKGCSDELTVSREILQGQHLENSLQCGKM